MDEKCFVLGCTSGFDGSKEKFHFFYPKDLKTLYLWLNAIPQKDRKLDESLNSVCHKHFKETDIIKFKTLKSKDGPVIADLDCWILVDGAIPTLRKPLNSLSSKDGVHVVTLQDNQQLAPSTVSSKIRIQCTLKPKDVFLPSSWFWQEGGPTRNQFICSKFEWLDNGNKFEYTKSVVVNGNTVRYFVRGQNVVHQDLKNEFSFANQLTSFLEVFDGLRLCVGCTDQELLKIATLSNALAAREIRSNHCLLLTSNISNCCNECSALNQTFIGATSNKSNNLISPRTTTQTQSVPRSEKKLIEKTPSVPQITYSRKNKRATTNKTPTEMLFNTTCSIADESCSHLQDHSYDTSNSRSVSLGAAKSPRNLSKRTANLNYEEHVHLPSGPNIRDEGIAESDPTIQEIPDRELVTFPFPSELDCSGVSPKGLEGSLINRTASLKKPNCALKAYISQTWGVGIYNPPKPYYAPRQVTAPVQIDEQIVTSSQRPQTAIASWRQSHVRCLKNVPREQPFSNNAVSTLACNVESMGTQTVNSQVTRNQELQPILPKPIIQQAFLPQNLLFQPVLLQLRVPQQQARLSQSNPEVKEGQNNREIVDEISIEEEKHDLALAMSFLKKEAKKKKLLRNKIRWLSKVLIKHKNIACSILKRTKEMKTQAMEQPNSIAVTRKPGPKAECKTCGKIVLAARLSIHLKTHSAGRSYLCDLCGRGFLHRASLSSHIRYNHRGVERPKRFLCTTCGYSCISKAKLELHERTHTDERPAACRYCDKRFRDKCTLVRHLRTHTGEKPYACNICGTSYSARDTYVNHYRRMHEKNISDNASKVRERSEETRVIYRCEFCQKTFARVLSYEKHRTTHTGEPTAIRCPVLNCNFTYSDLAQLKDHMASNHQDKTYNCAQCSKVFLTKRSLSSHKVTHDPALGFTCSSCPYVGTTKASLVTHQKIHTRETPHECSVCQMRFHSPFLLKRHMYEHKPGPRRKRSRKSVKKIIMKASSNTGFQECQ